MKRIALALSLTALAIPLLGSTSPAEAGDRHGRRGDRHERYDDRHGRHGDRHDRYDRHGKHYDRGHGEWHAQTRFRVGDLSFSLGYHQPTRRGAYYHPPRHYYRTRSRVSYKGYQCDSGCYKRSSHYYHTSACPLVQQHFRVYRYVPPPYYFSPYGAEYYYYPPSYYYDRGARYRSRSYRRGW